MFNNIKSMKYQETFNAAMGNIIKNKKRDDIFYF